MRQYGWESKYRIAFPHGRNSRLDELQAAILRVKLPGLDAANERRRAIHARYEQAATPAGIRMLNRADESFIGHLGVAVADDREAFQQHLADRGIRTDVHYPIPDHLQPLIAGEGTRSALPETERASASVLSLPLFPELRDDEIDRVCRALEEF
jgi:dTDP-4-amino-4,6-dideoxygalactose transaminase